MPSLPSQRAEMPSLPSQRAEMPSLPSQRAEMPSLPSQRAEMPSLPSQRAEMPSLPSQRAEMPSLPSQRAEMPSLPSQRAEMPSLPSQRAEMENEMDLPQLAADAPKGVAAGSVMPGLGMALGAVGGIALDLTPEIARWLFGPESASVTLAVQQAVHAVTGAYDPAAQAAALANPDLASQLRVELAGIAATRAAVAESAAEARHSAQLADVANGRAMAARLTQSGSSLAWGAPITSVVVLVTFGAVVSLVLLHTIPTGSETVLNVLLGTLAAMATNVVGYWVGSSAGSARKDERMAKLTVG